MAWRWELWAALVASILLASSWAAADTMYAIKDLGTAQEGSQIIGAAPTFGQFLSFEGLNSETISLGYGETNAGNYSVGTKTVIGPMGIPAATFAFVESAGQQTTLYPSVGYNNSVAFGVNSSGGVVGSYYTLGGGPAFYSGPAGDYLLPNALAAYAINDSNQIVGQEGGPLGYRAFLTTPGGAMIDLNTLVAANSGWDLKAATGINDKGEIVGYGTDPSGAVHAFELLPNAPNQVPEPSTLALFGLLGAGVGLRHMARRARCS